MTPDMRNGRPCQETPASKLVTATTAIVTVTPDIFSELTKEFSAGYRLGFEAGCDVGHAHGVAEEAAGWAHVLGIARAPWSEPTQDELAVLREVDHLPCSTPSCRVRCSRCIHAEAWKRRGGRDFLGLAAERLAVAS